MPVKMRRNTQSWFNICYEMLCRKNTGKSIAWQIRTSKRLNNCVSYILNGIMVLAYVAAQLNATLLSSSPRKII